MHSLTASSKEAKNSCKNHGNAAISLLLYTSHGESFGVSFLGCNFRLLKDACSVISSPSSPSVPSTSES